MKLMVVALAGWINQQQEDVIDYLREEIRILKEHQGKKRLRFTDDQRRRLASKAKRIASLLPPGCRVKSTIRVFGHYGVGAMGVMSPLDRMEENAGKKRC